VNGVKLTIHGISLIFIGIVFVILGLIYYLKFQASESNTNHYFKVKEGKLYINPQGNKDWIPIEEKAELIIKEEASKYGISMKQLKEAENEILLKSISDFQQIKPSITECPKCGNAIQSGEKVCSICGMEIK